ncbi:MAG: insulinase family protein [Muribaculum sp.]|nr:insulinase family protein [Muribaculaceae bacterium]MCM1080420.1 insulinase family protein [Muribaculum sp.]
MSTNNLSKWDVAPTVTGFGQLTMPEASVKNLDSGATLHVLRQGQLGVCRFSCLITGGLAECSGPGIAQLLLSAVQEGTVSHPGASLAETIEFNGATVQIGVYRHYMMLSVNMLTSKAPTVIPLVHEMLFAPEFNPQPFASCVERLAQNVRLMEKRVEYKATKKMKELIMGPSHPLAQSPSPDQIAAVTLDDLQLWHKLTCTSANGMQLYLAGNIDDAIVNLVAELFSNTGSESLPFNIKPNQPMPPQRADVEVADALQSAVRICAPVAITRDSADYLELRLLVKALGGYFGSRLMLNIREEKGYTYGISASLNGSPEGTTIEIATSTDPANAEPLIKETLNEIKRLKTSPFSNDEIDRLKNYETSMLASMLDTPFDMMDYYITLKTAFINQSEYFQRQYRAIQNLTPQRMSHLAEKYINSENFTVVVAGNVNENIVNHYNC